MIHKSVAYRAEVSWDLKILLTKHSRARSDEQELRKRQEVLFQWKMSWELKTGTFKLGFGNIWLAITWKPIYLFSLYFFFFPRMKRVVWGFFFLNFLVKIRLEGKSNEIISWLYQRCFPVTERSRKLCTVERGLQHIFLHLVSLWRTWDLGHWGPYSGWE